MFRWAYLHINIILAVRWREERRNERKKTEKRPRKCGVCFPRGDETLSRKQSGKMENKHFAVVHAAEELQPFCL